MTTMKFGVTRYGPSAPSTFQLGKYDVFTRTGVPTWSTSKSIVSVPVARLLTVAFATGRAGGVSPSVTRAHEDGPLSARYTSQLSGSRYHVIAGPFARIVLFCESTGAVCGSLVPYVHSRPLLCVVTTAGSLANACTIGASSIWNTCHAHPPTRSHDCTSPVPLDAISCRAGCAGAASTADGVDAM